MHRRPTARRLAGDLANLLDAEGKPEKAKTVRRGRCVDAGESGSGNGVRLSAMCANCRAIEPVGGDIKFSICTWCQVARYCSRDCQKSHWKAQHKTTRIRILVKHNGWMVPIADEHFRSERTSVLDVMQHFSLHPASGRG